MPASAMVAWGGREDWINELNYTQSMLAGNHNFSAGFNFKTVHVDTVLAGSRRGTFSFDGTWSGNPIADMLLGYPRTSTFTPSTANLTRQAAREALLGVLQRRSEGETNLTLNLGFRYEVNGAQYADDDAIASFDFKTGKIGVPDITKITPGSIDLSLVDNSPYGRILRKVQT